VPPFGEQRLNMMILKSVCYQSSVSNATNDPHTCRLKPLGHLPIVLQSSAIDIYNLKFSYYYKNSSQFLHVLENSYFTSVADLWC
jgi:hypothetical protein